MLARDSIFYFVLMFCEHSRILETDTIPQQNLLCFSLSRGKCYSTYTRCSPECLYVSALGHSRKMLLTATNIISRTEWVACIAVCNCSLLCKASTWLNGPTDLAIDDEHSISNSTTLMVPRGWSFPQWYSIITIAQKTIFLEVCTLNTLDPTLLVMPVFKLLRMVRDVPLAVRVVLRRCNIQDDSSFSRMHTNGNGAFYILTFKFVLVVHAGEELHP